jgi:hypothetical protein
MSACASEYQKLLSIPNNIWVGIFDDLPEFIRNSPPSIRSSLVDLYNSRIVETGMIQRKVNISKRRLQLLPSDVSPKERALYEQLLTEPDIDQQIACQTTKHVSGRILDSLVTKYTKVSNTVYYIVNNTYTPMKPMVEPYITVDLCSSYKSHIKKYSKACFDPFGRGYDIIHTTKNNEKIPFSLCRFMFHRWAEKYFVYDFLADHFDDVASLQRKDQQRLRSLRKTEPKSNDEHAKKRRKTNE